MKINQIIQQIETAGFIFLGAFHHTDTQTLVLIGNAGPVMWEHFSKAYAAESISLDNWTRKTVKTLAENLEADALFPFDEPPQPFLTWAEKSGATFTSPIGLSIHPEYGLWHGYRAALIIDGQLELRPETATSHPCETCADKPCLTTCPVDAFSTTGYDVPACISHIQTTDTPDCLEQGCRARRACPIGKEFHYSPEQAQFHMSAFLQANG